MRYTTKKHRAKNREKLIGGGGGTVLKKNKLVYLLIGLTDAES